MQTGIGFHLQTARFILRDFTHDDRDAFVAYQMHPQYRALYDHPDTAQTRETSRQLFDRFLGWQTETPRRNYQIGIFDRHDQGLIGCIGLRGKDMPDQTAAMGIELSPDHWGRYRLALEVSSMMIEHGFEKMGLVQIIGSTSSGNRRIAKLARLFGATLGDTREGAPWMQRRGWREIDWILDRENWRRLPRKWS